MSGYEAFQIYKALILHFSPETDYNFFKYGIKKIRTDPKAFNKRSDKFQFDRLAQKFSRRELTDLILANIIEDNTPAWVGTVMSSDSEEKYYIWKKRTDSFGYLFLREMDKILEDHQFKDLFKIPKNRLPLVFVLYFQKSLSLEGLIFLNLLCNYLPDFEQQLSKNPVCVDLFCRIKKYAPFLKFDLNSIGKKLKDKIERNYTKPQ